jgi:hypothetical protein
MRPRGAALLYIALYATQALASESGKSSMDLYRTGDYESAAAAGEAEATGEGLAVAARAVLSDAGLRDVPCMACLQKAEGLARRSIALDAKHPQAYVYLAATLGYEARIVGGLRARFARYPEQAKEAIDRALAIAPDDSWSLAAAGTWHIEVVRNGGKFIARTFYGARNEVGEDFLRRAVAAEPENLGIRFQRALLLSGLDLAANRKEVLGELTTATMIEPRTAYERALKGRAATLLELFKQNRQQEYTALVNRYQGYPS